MANSVFRLITRIFARKFVQALYISLLGRPADAEGLAAYAKSLRRSGKIENVARALANSSEARIRVLQESPSADVWSDTARLYPEPIIQAVFQILLQRDADPESLSAYASSLRSNGDLYNLINEISGSKEARDLAASLAIADSAWERIVRERAADFANIAFEALLLRSPEPQAREAYTQTLRETGDLRAIIRELGFSREHREKLLRQVSRS